MPLWQQEEVQALLRVGRDFLPLSSGHQYSSPIPYPLPVSLAIGDTVLIEAIGARTTTYSSVGFNCYPPQRQYVI